MNWLNKKGPLHNWDAAFPFVIYGMLIFAGVLGFLCCGICTFLWKLLVA